MAVFMLFVVGAMAALSIDVVTFYTARSEAQLAADGAALAAARVLANSGMTSDPSTDPNFATVVSTAKSRALSMATQVAQQNKVGGRFIAIGEITVSFPNDGQPQFQNNPHVSVQVRRTDLPTFFSRIWSATTMTIVATATAEAYNPSPNDTTIGVAVPVAPTCMKPWLMPNIDPVGGPPNQIFDPTSGVTLATDLFASTLPGFTTACTTCTLPLPAPAPLKYFPEDPADFIAPSAASIVCAGSAGFSPYQLNVAGCETKAIACNDAVNIDTAAYAARDADTATAVNCVTHAAAGGGDSIDTLNGPSPPFQFLTGADNPIVASGTDVMVSDSLVTVPVFDCGTPCVAPATTSVNLIGFVQLFLNPAGTAATVAGIPATVINVVGCGARATGTPILGNGASAVPVRLITSP